MSEHNLFEPHICPMCNTARLSIEQPRAELDDFLESLGIEAKCPNTAFVAHSQGSNLYRRDIRNAIRGLWSGAIDYDQFFDIMLLAVRTGQTRAFTEGSQMCGILPAEWTALEKMAIEQAINYENQWIAGLGRAVEAGSKANGGKLSSFWPRSEIWIGRYEGLRDKAKAMTCQDRKLRWVRGTTEKSCPSCSKLDGKIKRASYWHQKGILPRVHGAPYLECKGFRCDCILEITDEPMSKGPLPSLP